MSDIVDLTTLQCYYETLETLKGFLAGQKEPSEARRSDVSAGVSTRVKPLLTASAIMSWHVLCTQLNERWAEVREATQASNCMKTEEECSGNGDGIVSNEVLGSPYGTETQIEVLQSLTRIRDRWTSVLAHLLVLPPVREGIIWYTNASAEGTSSLPPLSSVSEIGLAYVVASYDTFEGFLASLPSGVSRSSNNPPRLSSFAVNSPLPIRLFAISCILGDSELSEALAPFTFLKEAMVCVEQRLLKGLVDSEHSTSKNDYSPSFGGGEYRQHEFAVAASLVKKTLCPLWGVGWFDNQNGKGENGGKASHEPQLSGTPQNESERTDGNHILSKMLHVLPIGSSLVIEQTTIEAAPDASSRHETPSRDLAHNLAFYLRPTASSSAQSASPLRKAAVSLFKAISESRALALSEMYKIPTTVYDSFKAYEYIRDVLTLDVERFILSDSEETEGYHGHTLESDNGVGGDRDYKNNSGNNDSFGRDSEGEASFFHVQSGSSAQNMGGRGDRRLSSETRQYSPRPQQGNSEEGGQKGGEGGFEPFFRPIFKPLQREIFVTALIDEDEILSGSAPSLPSSLRVSKLSAPCVCSPLAPVLTALTSHRETGFTVGEVSFTFAFRNSNKAPVSADRNGDEENSSRYESTYIPVALRLPPFLSVDGTKITAAFGSTLLRSEHHVFAQTDGSFSESSRRKRGESGQQPHRAPLPPFVVASFSSTPDDRRWLESSYSQTVSFLALFAHHVGERYSPPALAGMLPVVNDLLRASNLLGIRSDMILFTASVENYGSIASSRLRQHALALMQHTTAAVALAKRGAIKASRKMARMSGKCGPLRKVPQHQGEAQTEPRTRKNAAPRSARDRGGGLEVLTSDVRHGDLIKIRLREEKGSLEALAHDLLTTSAGQTCSHDEPDETSSLLSAMCTELSPTDPTSTHLTLRHHPVKDLALRMMLFTSLAYKRISTEVRLVVARAVASVYDDSDLMESILKDAAKRQAAKEKREAKEKERERKAGKDVSSSSSSPEPQLDSRRLLSSDPSLFEASPLAAGILVNLLHPLVCVTRALPDISSPSSSSTVLSGYSFSTAPNAGTHVIRYAFHEVLTTLEQQYHSKVESSKARSNNSSLAERWALVIEGDRRSILKYAAVCPLLDFVGDPFLRDQILEM